MKERTAAELQMWVRWVGEGLGHTKRKENYKVNRTLKFPPILVISFLFIFVVFLEGGVGVCKSMTLYLDPTSSQPYVCMWDSSLFFLYGFLFLFLKSECYVVKNWVTD